MITVSKSVLASTVAIGTLFAASAAMAQTRQFNIPSEEAAKSIPEFGRQAGIQITAPVSDLHGVKTPAILGEQDLHAALVKLLAGTGLEVASEDGATIVLRRSLASPDSSLPSPGAEDAAQAVTLNEVVVTAQKKEEKLRDTPVPVSVINTGDLATNGQVLMRDYFSSVPSLEATPNVFGQTQITIRGVTTGFDPNPTVAFLIDDVPYGATVGSGISFSLPDLDPSDLERVEVLRGPQGTLYGADSLGGLVKFVTKAPTFDQFSGRAEAGVNSVSNGAEPGYSFRASVNIPISDTFAMRVSGFGRQDAGYIDNIVTGQRGINQAETNGGRLTALWKPSGDFSIRLTALYQHTHGDGSPEVAALPDVGELKQNFLAQTGTYTTEAQAYSAVVNYKAGLVNLTSVTGYSSLTADNIQDYTSSFGGLVNTVLKLPPGTLASPFFYNAHVRNFSQELRFAAPIGELFDTQGGFFFTNQNSPTGVVIGTANPVTGALGQNLANLPVPSTFRESGLYADVTYHVTSRFECDARKRRDLALEDSEVFVPH